LRRSSLLPNNSAKQPEEFTKKQMFYEDVEHNFKDRCRFLNYLLLHRRQVQAIVCCVLLPPAREVQGYG